MTLIFHHIPKSAGTTLATFLRRRYAPDEEYRMAEHGFERRTALSDLDSGQKQRIRLVTGHLDFGVHEELPQPSIYFTVLRDPVERIISHYYFVRRTPGHYLFNSVSSQKMTLDDYVESELTLELNNGQVRTLYGREHRRFGYGQCPNEMLATAFRNIQSHYLLVGLTERFDETALLLRQRLGWSFWPFYVSKNVASHKPAPEAISARTLDRIRSDNALDIQLYERAAELFDESLRESGIGKELRTFRNLNRAYAHYAGAANTVRRIKRRCLRHSPNAVF